MKEGAQSILVVGELNADLILNRINGFPTVGKEILAEEMTLVLGSSSAIFASNAASLGLPVSFFGRIGRDLFGDLVLAALGKRNVDTTLIEVSGEDRTGLTVSLNYPEDRANITFCGAMEALEVSDRLLDALPRFRHLHFSSYFLQKGMQPGVPRLFRAAREAGLTTSLDLQWDPSDRWEFPYESCLPDVDIFLPNEAELLALTGEKDLRQAIRKAGRYGRRIVVKRGAEGALALEDGRMVTAAPFPHGQFRDSIGAGDSFNAGFIKAFLGGAPLDECLRLANLAGAVSTTEAGGTAAFSDPAAFKRKVKELFDIAL